LNHGINIYADAAQVRACPAYFKSWRARALIDRLFPQVVFYQSDYTRQMEAVLRGEVDVGFMLSGWMEANYPHNIPLFQLLGPKQVSYQSETYPFLTSTEIVPSYGVSAAPYIPWVLQQQVYNALSAINEAQPEAIAAGIFGFSLAASYAMTREIGTKVGVFYESKDRGVTCRDPFADPYEYVMCPPGYMKETLQAIHNSCKRRRLTCPEGLECVCRPCIPVLAVNVFPWQIVMGLCAALFAAALFLTVGWRMAMDAAQVARSESFSRYRHGRGWKA
jgi:hypothetical protein